MKHVKEKIKNNKKNQISWSTILFKSFYKAFNALARLK